MLNINWKKLKLINHGINPSTLEKVKISVEEFFSLPMKEKKKFWQNQGDLEGYGQNFVVSEEQKLEWAEGTSSREVPSLLAIWGSITETP